MDRRGKMQKRLWCSVPNGSHVKTLIAAVEWLRQAKWTAWWSCFVSCISPSFSLYLIFLSLSLSVVLVLFYLVLSSLVLFCLILPCLFLYFTYLCLYLLSLFPLHFSACPYICSNVHRNMTEHRGATSAPLLPPPTHIINKGEEPESMPYCPSILTWRGSTWWRGPRWGRARHRGPQLDGRVSATDSDPCEKTHKKIN